MIEKDNIDSIKPEENIQGQNINLQMTHVNQGLQELPTDYKFLFLFEPKELAYKGFCNLSLKTSVQIISVLFLFSSALSFLSSLYSFNLIDLVLNAVSFLLYLVAAICLFVSIKNKDAHIASTGYTIYALIFILSFINFVLTALLIFLGVLKPFNSSDPFRTGLVYSFASLVVLSVHCYLIWLIYSFTVHLRQNRLNLIEGEIYKDYKEYEDYNISTINNK